MRRNEHIHPTANGKGLGCMKGSSKEEQEAEEKQEADMSTSTCCSKQAPAARKNLVLLRARSGRPAGSGQDLGGQKRCKGFGAQAAASKIVLGDLC